MEKKIDELFEYRKLPQLLAKGHYSKDGSLYKGLVQLQIAIYHLDLYLEANWNTKKSDLNRYWKEIYQCMKNLGYNKKRGEAYLKDIQRYQKHELQLRTKKDYSLSDWRIFDLITEIDDDVEDVFEDLNNINGNYFMLMLMEKDKQEVSKYFAAYLKELGKRARKRFVSKDKSTKEIKSMTLKELKSSQELLEKQIKKWKPSYVKKMELLKYYDLENA